MQHQKVLSKKSNIYGLGIISSIYSFNNFFIVGVYWFLLRRDEANRDLYYWQIGCFAFLAVIVLVIVYPPSFLIIIGIGVLVSIIYILRENKEEKRFEEKKIVFNEKKAELLNSEHYKYIELFVKRFMDSKYELSEIHKLYDLLQYKNVDIDFEELNWLINDEAKAQQYNDFKSRITSNSPQTFEDFAENFLEIYAEDYLQNIQLFTKLLTEKNIIYDPHKIRGQLRYRFENIQKSIERERFEKSLFEENNLSSIESLDLLSGYEFENFLKNLFEKMGFTVQQTKLSGDQGADLILSKFGEKTAVQAKRTSNKVGNKAIQEIVAAINHYSVNKGMVVITSYFTRQAVELANSNKIELIDRDKLQLLMKKHL